MLFEYVSEFILKTLFDVIIIALWLYNYVAKIEFSQIMCETVAESVSILSNKTMTPKTVTELKIQLKNYY